MIRRIKQADTVKLNDLLKKAENFTAAEIATAMELINIAAFNPEQKDYHIFVYEEEEKLLGYHCTGLRPLTDGTYDLYWIAADPAAKGKGVGKELLQHAENFVVEHNGRWLLAETSSKDSYSGTRNFYHRNNYSIVSQINDFYALGDNLIVFGKYFYKQKNS